MAGQQKSLPVEELGEITKKLRRHIITMIGKAGSGHPGGSRSKVHALVVTLLSGVMRWDIRHPEKRFGDRFILIAGHTIPLVYATLAVLNEALRVKYQQTGDDKYLIPNPEERALYWEDLLEFRHNKGLSGHAEMEGKTLFLKRKDMIILYGRYGGYSFQPWMPMRSTKRHPPKLFLS